MAWVGFNPYSHLLIDTWGRGCPVAGLRYAPGVTKGKPGQPDLPTLRTPHYLLTYLGNQPCKAVSTPVRRNDGHHLNQSVTVLVHFAMRHASQAIATGRYNNDMQLTLHSIIWPSRSVRHLSLTNYLLGGEGGGPGSGQCTYKSCCYPSHHSIPRHLPPCSSPSNCDLTYDNPLAMPRSLSRVGAGASYGCSHAWPKRRSSQVLLIG